MSRRKSTNEVQDNKNYKYSSFSKLKNYSANFTPKTENQKKMIKSIEENVVTFGVGFPGVGKTFIAAAAGMQMLLENKVDKIVIIRDNVPAGEAIGHLPGSADEKQAPYMEHIFEIFDKLIPDYALETLYDEGKIEMKALSFLRGSNFEKSFIIVDESQNLTAKLFYLLLSRICDGSKMVICGDSKQCDLKFNKKSGLQDALSKVNNIEGIGIIEFDLHDCVRAPIVKEIIKAYYNDDFA